MLRRFLCCANGRIPPTSDAAAAGRKMNLVFMGSPHVSASVLDALCASSKSPGSLFQVAAIVTMPPSVRGRGRKLLPSPVAQHAMENGFPQELIFSPERAGEEAFLMDFKALSPDVCITAAYGKILPTTFLEVPPYGTINVHPSLLPLYRGAAPVQRALQDGVKETGVSLAFTVRALDSGPIIASQKVEVDDLIKAPELLSMLFGLGSELLICELPHVFDGSAKLKAQAQDDTKATLAPKLTSDESWLSFDQEAHILHNKVRAFSGWPGTRARFQVLDENGHPNLLEIKVITTRVGSSYDKDDHGNEIKLVGGALIIGCAGGSTLEVLELQPPGKKILGARDFFNGLRSQTLKKIEAPQTQALEV